MRRASLSSRVALAAAGLCLGPLFASGCADPKLADLPALCSENTCPEGLACIHGVCASPGTPIPITVIRLNNFQGRDLKIVPQASSVLVTWQTYAYSETGERFVGARVSADGSVSQEMTLVSSFEADDDASEPFYDVLATSDTELLLAVSAAPLGGDESAEPRLIAYSVKLPPEGRESEGAQFGSPWSSELRMSTIGYGAVSKPKLVAHGSGVDLGYFQTRTAQSDADPMKQETRGELAVIKLAKDGTQIDGGTSYHRARDGLPVAVNVEGAFAADGGVFWALDHDRPSALFIDDANMATEGKLERLSIALSAQGSDLSYLQPSDRTGEKLASDPASGPVSIHHLMYAAAGGTGSLTTELIKPAATLPTIRDTPRPAWVDRPGKPSILVTPGAEESAKELVVYTMDVSNATASEVARIDRFGTTPVDAVVATVVNGNLYVAWADGGETSIIRMAILPEP